MRAEVKTRPTVPTETSGGMLGPFVRSESLKKAHVHDTYFIVI